MKYLKSIQLFQKQNELLNEIWELFRASSDFSGKFHSLLVEQLANNRVDDVVPSIIPYTPNYRSNKTPTVNCWNCSTRLIDASQDRTAGDPSARDRRSIRAPASPKRPYRHRRHLHETL